MLLEVWIAAMLMGPAQTPEARATTLEQSAAIHFEAGDYEAARTDLEAARALSPRPTQLYSMGRIAKELGDCGAVVELFEAFLEEAGEGASALSKVQAEEFIATCREAGAPAPVAAPPAPGLDPPPPRLVDRQPPPPWFRDALGGALLGIGVAAGGAGGIVLGLGVHNGLAVPDAGSEDAFKAEARDARTMRVAGAVTLAAGGALVVGAIIRYVLVARGLTGSRRSRQRSAPASAQRTTP